MAKKLNNKYELGQAVFLATDPEQYERMVTIISISIGNVISYTLVCGTEISEHFEEEISEERSVI